MKTMEIWNKVSTTDAKYVKGFSRGGGFRGTAINATWLAREATKTFGPCGTGWGIRVLDEKYVEGHYIDERNRSITHVVRVQLWYMLDGKEGSIEQYGQTTMVGSNKNGCFTDEEAPKKSITDAMSKCLSLLGFGSDIHLGLYDDNKYVADRQREAGKSDQPDADPAAVEQAKAGIGKCKTKDALTAHMKSLPPEVASAVRDDAVAHLSTLED